MKISNKKWKMLNLKFKTKKDIKIFQTKKQRIIDIIFSIKYSFLLILLNFMLNANIYL